MPISNKDLGNYKRPGIFIVENDQSFIELPIQEVLINLVPGFSKRGPVNKPVQVNNPTDFEKIFGTQDKNLENKGSYFHRTVEDMLKKGPVWALNLLKTDPERDLLEWQSISVASQFNNGPKNTSPYENFFNRQDFWERDSESFMDIVDIEHADNSNQPDPAQVLLHLTNMGEKVITVFTFKSTITGFDVSAEDWYGGLDKIPTFMNPKDWISDYMISILVISGDWSDYAKLSVDTYWGKYFNVNGLIKTKIQDFVNDRLTNTVAYYDVSLIPNFRDYSGRDMYVKNIINQNTEKTGLFCYYNEDSLLNSDYYKGAVDIIGQTLVCTERQYEPGGTCKKSIDFMSYKTNLGGHTAYVEKLLDSASNVFGNYATDMSSSSWSDTRTAVNTNWYTNVHPSSTGVTSTINNITSITTPVISLSAVTTLTVDDEIYFSKSFGIIDSTTPYYVIEKPSTSSLKISTTKGGAALNGITSGTTTGIFIYTLKETFVDSVTTGNTYTINGVNYDLVDLTLFHEPFVITNSATTYSRYDVVYLNSDTSNVWTLKGAQVTGTSPSKPNFMLTNENTIILGYVKLEYNGSSSFALTWNSVTVDGAGYLTLTGAEIYGISGLTSGSVKYLDLVFVGTSGTTNYSDYVKLRKSKIFHEIYTKLLTGYSVIISSVDGYKYKITSPTVYNATSTTDAFVRIYFDSLSATNVNDYYNSGGIVIYYVDDEYVMPSGDVDGILTGNYPLSGTTTYGVVGKNSTLYLAYYNGEINNGDYIYLNNDDTSTKVYIKMYLDSDKNLTIKFASAPEAADNIQLTGWDVYYRATGGFIIYSDIASYKQTVEIENPDYLTDLTNVNYIYIDKNRFSEIQKGWFLEAYYDTSYYDSPGQGYIMGAVPRKLVRVTKVVIDSVNPNFKIVYTDGPIKILNNLTYPLTDYYTTAYMSIDNYVSEYNGVTFAPFVIHQDSIPNGTDERLSAILTALDKNSNLTKGLANKNRISWRYLVDSFGLGLTSNSKQEFVDLCGLKLNCFGFINMPSVRQFKTSASPSFVNDDRTINTEYIKDGGNLDLNPNFLYGFGDGDGMSCVGYFFPYIKDSSQDSDIGKFVPPAAKMAKAYMSKFTGELQNAYPWTIVAGPQLSLLNEVSATEMRFTNTDLENLYSMGANPVVYSLNRGYNINSESTAQVFPISSLSYIHSREVLIELENRLYDMLLNYQWRFNTPEIRAEIKFRADQICKELLSSNALYDFKNVCDKTNNTDYLIDLQMGVLDTYVEIIKGMGIIVNNITILKKGTIQSGGFLPA